MKSPPVALLLALALTACDALAPTPAPTEALFPTPVTVLPQIPTLDETQPPGVSNLEAASAPSGGAVPLTVEIPAPDGLALATLYYPQPQTAPGVLLLHAEDGSKQDWDAVAGWLQAEGFAVLVPDLRGFGATGGAPDWTLARGDTLAALGFLGVQPNVDPARLGIVGAGVGANLALAGCADSAACRAAGALSPGLDYQGVVTEGAVAALGARAALFVASEDDAYATQSARALDAQAQGDHTLRIYQSAGHGTAMFSVEPDLLDFIKDWLKAHL